MKLRKIVALVMALMLAAMTACMPAMAASDMKVKTTDSVHLRKGPGLDYGKVTSFSTGKYHTESFPEVLLIVNSRHRNELHCGYSKMCKSNTLDLIEIHYYDKYHRVLLDSYDEQLKYLESLDQEFLNHILNL